MKQVLAIAALVFLVGGCEPEAKQRLSEARGKSSEALNAVEAAAGAEGEAYKKRLDLRMQALSARIAGLHKRIERLEGKAKQQAEARLAELEKKREALLSESETLEGKSGDAWRSAKSGIDRAVDELESTYEDIRETFE